MWATLAGCGFRNKLRARYCTVSQLNAGIRTEGLDSELDFKLTPECAKRQRTPFAANAIRSSIRATPSESVASPCSAGSGSAWALNSKMH